METSTPTQKRPRIHPVRVKDVEMIRPDVPFERAVDETIQEAIQARAMLAECILDLEGDRSSVKEFMGRRNELVETTDCVSLVRILKLRLRDRGVEL
jgi:hypothetical protein